MKIIILSFFLTSQAQYIDDITTINYFNLINNNETNLTTFENDIWSSTSSFDITQPIIIRNKINKWINVNQTNKKDSSNIFWRKLNDYSRYTLRSEGQCLNKMCKIKLKYNGSLSNKYSGCLSFILSTRGQPVGQLWIEEDQEQENFSQKIQLTNSSLRVQHSLRSKIKNLSIDTRILFRNSKLDTITLSNLNINWKGPCPKHRSNITPIQNQFTSEYYLTTEDYSTLTTNNEFETNQKDYFIQSTTIKYSSSFINQSNLGWILSLVISFCFLIILSSFIYGFWTIQGHYRFTWYVPFDNPIQFIGRRSIRSSTRSKNKIKTLSQISNELSQNNFDNLSTISSRSTHSASFAYF